MSPTRFAAVLACAAAAGFPAVAGAQKIGYQLDRYEPTTAGDPFLAVEHPWYSSVRRAAAGLTLDYANDLLVRGTYDASGNLMRTNAIVAHSLRGHIDAAVSFADRIAISASLPVVLYEGGTDVGSGLRPLDTVAAGDPRVGARVRIFGQPESSPASLSAGVDFWIPLGAYSEERLTGEACCRVAPRLMFGGVVGDHFRYSVNAGFLYRQQAQVSSVVSGAGNTVDSEVQLGVGAQAMMLKRTLSFGPEVLVSFPVPTGGSLPTQQSITDLEIFGGIHYLAINQILLSVGGAAGLYGSPGPPDARAILRIAYAPRSDGKEAPSDRDHDGVLDDDDRCPDEPAGDAPDPKRRGCPSRDRDGDGVPDALDKCPRVPAGPHPDPKRAGCPEKDSDGDGTVDSQDQCPNEKSGINPDPKRRGCPAADRDHDAVPDPVDACPDVPGSPSPDPRKNGCPGLVKVESETIQILEQVHFEVDKTDILPESFRILDAVAFALESHPVIKRISVEGHTDNQGSADFNMNLSQKRAESVVEYLITKGIARDRLEPHGFGFSRPVSDNKTAAGRQANRRVEFHIVDLGSVRGAVEVTAEKGVSMRPIIRFATLLVLTAGCSDPPAATSCLDGLTSCSGVCVDTTKDVMNCGACGTACPPGNVCLAGACSLTCPTGETICDGRCVDTGSDPAHCGDCQTACPPGNVCSTGKCAISCQGGLTNCSGACVNPKTDAANCGACGTACPAGQACTDGACALTCQMGLTNCNGTCVNTQSDLANCGMCGTACAPGQVCSAGACALSCQTGLTNCNGTCANTQADLANCGMCGMACAPGQVCSAGVCALSCQMGLTNCNGTCANTQSDLANCGMCGTSCVPGQVCSMGACALSCQMGLTNCNGICANTQNDLANCGACGTACAPGQVCSMGACALSCQVGLTMCNNVCVNLQSDDANCGMCGTACPQGQSCQAGACVATCQAPLTACNGACVDPRFDPLNCNGCGMACAVPNAAPACNMGKCIVGLCDQGRADCDSKPNNGCETDTTSDSKNCGGCGMACAKTETCCNSGCIPAMQDNNNCGGCGVVCGNGTQCCGGACLDPKFAQVMTLDCSRPFVVGEVQGGGFGNTGTLSQLVADMNGAATLPANQNPPPAQSPQIWIAAHDSNQVHRVNTKTGAIIDTYSSRGHHPSRGAAALDGSFWIANRGDDSPNDPNISNVAQILPDGTPGCYIQKAADGAGLPFCRALAIDANGFVWLGTWNDHRLHKIDPAQCKVIADYNMTANINGTTYSSYPYGLAVDRNGIMWNSNIGSGWQGVTSWMGMDVTDPDPAKNTFKYAVDNGGRSSYGVVIDRSNNVYFAQWGPCQGGIWRLDAANNYAVSNINGPTANCTRGITLDVTGDIYTAEWGPSPVCVSKFAGGTGAYLNRFCLPGLGQGVGIAGDTYGKIWQTGYTSNNVTRFNPDGTVDQGFPVPLTGTTYYNYSDWNGMILKTVTSNNAQAGTWTWDIDSGSPITQWATATWQAVTPKGTSTAVYFKTATAPAQFANRPFCGPFYSQPVDLTACNFGPTRYMEVQVVLNTIDVNVRPTLSDFKVYYQ